MRLDKRQHGVNLQVCLTIKLELHLVEFELYCQTISCCGFAVQIVVQQIHNKSNKWSSSFSHDGMVMMSIVF